MMDRLYGLCATVVGTVLLMIGSSLLLLLCHTHQAAWRFAHRYTSFVLRIVGLMPAITGTARPTGTAVLVSNHSSFLDGLLLIAALKDPVLLTPKMEVMGWPIVGNVTRRLGAMPIDRTTGRGRHLSCVAIARAIRDGYSVHLFPEGTFEAREGVLPFHAGAFEVAAQAGVPIVPIAIRGARDVLPAGRYVPRHRPMEVRVLEPIDPRNELTGSPAAMSDAARSALAQTVDEPLLPRRRVRRLTIGTAIVGLLLFAAYLSPIKRPPSSSSATHADWTERPAASPLVRQVAGGGVDSVGILPRYRTLAYYGNPLSTKMGILGLQPPDSMFARLERQAAAYAAADPATPVWPALHLVAVVAQPDAGGDGMYRHRMPAYLIETVASWAEERGYLLFLDVQLGRSTIDAELDYLMPFLMRPYVHLALDPEFAMRPGQVPGDVIGSLDARHVNAAIERLAEVAEQHRLPPRMLVIHRFTRPMLTGASKIRLHPRVQVVVDMDGFGSKELKRASYRVSVRDEPVQFAGIKLFYRQDRPLLSPEEVLQLDPVPNLVIYQ